MRATLSSVGRLTIGAVLVMTAGISGGCGDSSSPPPGSAAPTATPVATDPGTTPGGTTPGTTSPAIPVAESDRAKAATVTVADVGGNATEHTPARALSVTGTGCSGTVYAPLAAGSGWTGAIIQLGAQKNYLSSTAYVFSTEADAQALVAVRNSSPWADCRRDALTKGLNVPDYGWKTDSTTIDGLGSNGFEGYTRFKVVNQKDAAEETGRALAHYLFRIGGVVIDIEVESNVLAGDPPDTGATVEAQANAAIAAVFTRIRG